ncbi:MAG: DUF4115 domain-containing protein [Candidatus Rokubacteria bacterium]|nr:DUF4115 domain-containing protein [Candidatus Rokubacteria bacterium]MBI3827774.1 DUF4115 domain-containing protein [Candidatus Rokubacteria bacterium]
MSVGGYLRELRHKNGLSLEEIARATRVASRYLEALEADQHDALLAPVFTRGFIRAYCQVLSVPPDEALALYAEAVGTTVGTNGRGVRREADPARARRAGGTVLVSFVLLVVFGVALVVVTLLLQSGHERSREPVALPRPDAPIPRQPPAPRATAPAPRSHDVAPSAPSAGAPPTAPASASSPLPSVSTLTPQPVPARAGPAPASGAGAPYRLVARAHEPTWLRVRMDDGRMTEETIPGGEVREWVSDRPFVLTIGNAGGVTLELNGRPLPPLGGKGVVVPRLVVPPPGP